MNQFSNTSPINILSLEYFANVASQFYLNYPEHGVFDIEKFGENKSKTEKIKLLKDFFEKITNNPPIPQDYQQVYVFSIIDCEESLKQNVSLVYEGLKIIETNKDSDPDVKSKFEKQAEVVSNNYWANRKRKSFVGRDKVLVDPAQGITYPRLSLQKIAYISSRLGLNLNEFNQQPTFFDQFEMVKKSLQKTLAEDVNRKLVVGSSLQVLSNALLGLTLIKNRQDLDPSVQEQFNTYTDLMKDLVSKK